ncbi:hypothetical protein PBI_GRAYSON_41 [Rhodococcus phage Grayson]|nr:hypothetical protein PBI_GRAYSON_41 [Rhodococcus phage Grayson]
MNKPEIKVVKVQDQYIVTRSGSAWQMPDLQIEDVNGDSFIFQKNVDQNQVTVPYEPAKISYKDIKHVYGGWVNEGLEITHEEYQDRREVLLVNAYLVDEDWDFGDDLDAEFEYKKFIQKWRRQSVAQDIWIPLDFSVVYMGEKSNDKDITPIVSLSDQHFGLYHVNISTTALSRRIQDKIEGTGFTVEWDNPNSFKRPTWERRYGKLSLDIDFTHKAFSNTREKWQFSSEAIGSLEECKKFKQTELERVDTYMDGFLAKFDSLDGVVKKDVLAKLETLKKNFGYFEPPYSHTNKRAKFNSSRNIVNQIIDLLN